MNRLCECGCGRAADHPGSNGRYTSTEGIAPCRCERCRLAHRHHDRRVGGWLRGRSWEQRDRQLDSPWIVFDIPVALINRKDWPDDDEAIRAAFAEKAP